MQNGPLENGFTEPIVNGGNPDACPSSTPTVNGYRSQTPEQFKNHGVPQEQDDSERYSEAQDNNGPPSKRRKLADPATRHSSTPRPISPPWKKIAVEGPTSFIEGGRRKSSRTNFVPLELQPQASKRQTRANAQHTQIRKVKPAVVATFKSSPLIPSASQHAVHSKRPTSSGTNKSPSKATQTNGNSHKEQASPATPVKRSHKKKVPAAPVSSVTNPHQNRRLYRTSDMSDPSKKSECNVTNGWHQREDEGNSRQDSAEDGHQAVPAMGSPFKTQRLNLKVRMPTITISHPDHVPARRRHPSFQDWFHHEESLIGEGIPRVTDEEARREANVISRVLDAGQSGGLLSEEKCSKHLPDHQDEPPQQYAHQDYMVAAVIDFQKRLIQERIKHKKIAKQAAEQCLVAWERRETRRGREVTVRSQVIKSAEEVETEVTDACETYYRQSVIGSLKRMFERVVAEIESRRRERWRAEQQRLGRENLNRVLERSTRMLHKRSGAVSGSGSEEESAGDSADEGPSTRAQSVDDEMLTVEELHQKYAQLPSLRGSSRDGSQSGDEVYDENSRRESVDVDPGGPAEQHTRDIPVNVDTGGRASPEKTEARLSARISVADHIDDVLMDDSDASTNMDDDMGDSDRGSSDEGSEDLDQEADRSGESQVSDQEAGLLGFFPKDAWKNNLRHGDPKGAEQADHPMVEEDHTGMSARTEEARSLPDATQVQTPSASNGEEPLLGHTKASNDEWINGSEKTEEDVSQQTLSDQPITARIPSIELGGVNKQPSYQQISLPTTPVSTTAISTPVPSLLRGTLREYQHVGLDWLAKLYSNRQNGILADEMGLGKTIQTIALLAHLAINHEAWGPHLIVVPTSVMLNWEMEFKKFLPGFKVLTYYGTIEERKRKREGWMNDDKWNVWITSYALVVQDNQIFRRRDWHYMVLDEAHNIKNFRSQRWQTLLNFKTRARLLLTGTPLQNNLTELWSLLFFTISADGSGQGANGFASLQEFSEWFQEPVKQIMENGKETMDENTQGVVNKLHHTLRPHLLRRLKADVEKQMPGKYEHIVYCRLSKRQRELYQGFLNRADTKAIYASGNHLSMMNCIMQLRKVCCHPDLFETRQIVTSFAMSRSVVVDFEIKDLLIRRRLLQEDLGKTVDLGFINLLPGANEPLSALDTIQKQRLGALGTLRQLYAQQWSRFKQNMHFDGSSVEGTLAHMENVAKRARFESLRHASYHTMLRSQRRPLYSHGLLSRLDLGLGTYPLPPQPLRKAQLAEHSLSTPSSLADMIVTLPRRSQAMETTIQKYACITPKVVATDMRELATPRQALDVLRPSPQSSPRDAFHEPRMRLSIAFPDKRLLQFDCGKLQSLDNLLRKLQAGGHRALVFTQMTKVLDVLEQFLNIHGWRYLRLDGGTKIEQRQILTERFNNDDKIPVFILSTRSGGLGINLTGADSVIFYDSDWNPAMDKQCQDRSHRIGQTREVHIYRLVSESTVEVNIMRRARQKTRLDEVVIQEGQFTTDRFQDVTAIDLGNSAPDDGDEETNAALDRVLGGRSMDKVFAQVEDKEDVAAAKIAEKEMLQTDYADFDEKAIPSSAGAMTPKTPASQTPRPPSAGADAVEQPAVPDAAVVVPDVAVPIPKATPAVDVVVKEIKVAEKAGHIDDYMLRLIEWELKDVPLPPDPDMVKKKKKKGEEYKVRKRIR